MPRLPLRGADLVLMAMHSRWAAAGASNNAMMVVECDGPVPPARLRHTVDRLLDVCPWSASRLRRPFPWGALHWAAGRRAALAPPPIRTVAAATSADVHRELETDLNAAIDPRVEAPLRFLLVDAGAGSRGYLVLTWFHPLMDPRGSRGLLAYLAHLDGTEAGPRGTTHPTWSGPPDPRSLRVRGALGRKSLAYMQALAHEPPVSPGSGLVSPGPARFHQTGLAEAETRDRLHRDIAWRLALAGRAMAELWRRRGFPDAPFLLPIAVDLRPKGEPGAIFGNQLAFHFARFRPSQTGDLPRLARDLREQMADAVRTGEIDANAVAMEFLRFRPVTRMLRALPWAAGGETFSFHCADLGGFPETLERVFGRRVLDAYHVPAVMPSPGIGIFFNRCGDRENLVVSWIDGAVSDEEAARVVEAVVEGMTWVHSP